MIIFSPSKTANILFYKVKKIFYISPMPLLKKQTFFWFGLYGFSGTGRSIGLGPKLTKISSTPKIFASVTDSASYKMRPKRLSMD